MRSILQKSNVAFSAAALAVLLTVGSPAVAFAEGSDDRSGSGSGSGSTSGSSSMYESGSTSGSTSTSGSRSTVGHTATSGSTTRVESTTTRTENETSHVESESATPEAEASETSENNTESRHNKAEKMFKVLKAERKSEKTDEQKTKACSERKQGLETKFTSIARNSAAYQARIDTILAQAIVYKAESKLSPTNFDALVKAATNAQATAKVSVAALQTASTTPIDCADKTVATDVVEFKVTAANARRDLKAYKMSVKAVLQSLRAANDDNATPVTTETPKTTEKSN